MQMVAKQMHLPQKNRSGHTRSDYTDQHQIHNEPTQIPEQHQHQHRQHQCNQTQVDHLVPAAAQILGYLLVELDQTSFRHVRVLLELGLAQATIADGNAN